MLLRCCQNREISKQSAKSFLLFPPHLLEEEETKLSQLTSDSGIDSWGWFFKKIVTYLVMIKEMPFFTFLGNRYCYPWAVAVQLQ